ncbi:MAG: hypothetical protein QFF03_12385 [Pseudomonadota bacterium]|nr:hypothetical protein [Pseudomonadota bacterium]
MSRAARFIVFVASAGVAGAAVWASTGAQASLDDELAAVAERAYVAPREALDTLAMIRAAHPFLSPRHRALVVEQSSRAKFYAGDFGGALRDAQALETLGKQQHDRSVECVGLLSQSYAQWMLGKIELAHALAREAEWFSPAAVSVEARVKALLTLALLEVEEHELPAAQQASDEAVRLAKGTDDDALVFMALKTEANTALAVHDLPLAQKAVSELLALAAHSTYRERLVRAKTVEYAVASAAGQAARAGAVMVEQIRLMRELHLDEALGRTLVDYADVQLAAQRYADAAALSAQALQLATVLAEQQLAGRAHFDHAIAAIRLGKVADGKAEVARLLAVHRDRAPLLAGLPQYAVALSDAGEAAASAQARALHRQISSDQARLKAQGQIDAPADATVNPLDTLNARVRRHGWLIVALAAAMATIGMVVFYRRRTPARASRSLDG